MDQGPGSAVMRTANLPQTGSNSDCDQFSSIGTMTNPARDTEIDLIGLPTIIHPSRRPNKPFGMTFFGYFFKFNSASGKRTFYKALVLCITFLAYSCYHAGRRPLSIVKNVLNRNCTTVSKYPELYDDGSYFDYGNQLNVFTTKPPKPDWCDWAPFNDDSTANQMLALLDSAFLFSYAICMFFSGYLADRSNLRYFLSGGLVLSGLLLYAFGMAFYLDIHSMSYFVIVQILSGIVQTTGWPAVVACIGNWFDNSSRGAIFGIWNANTNLGNIFGAVIAGYFVEQAWGLSFIVIGFIMLAAGVMVFLFLVPRPEDVDLPPIKHNKDPKNEQPSSNIIRQDQDLEASGSSDPNSKAKIRRKSPRATDHDDSGTNMGSDDGQLIDNSEHSPLISAAQSHEDLSPEHAASFWTCLRIPGVIEFSLSLAFAKLVSYTFLYWLPKYINQSTSNNSEQSAYLSVPFDVGGIFGAIAAGYMSDIYKKSAIVCSIMLILAVPSMFIYEQYASISNTHNILLQILTGLLTTGPYSLITTAVSADLGSRVKTGKAMATVASIIDGAGSIGAAAGPLFAGYISDSGWQAVFMMLMVSDLLALLCLTRVTLKELGFR